MPYIKRTDGLAATIAGRTCLAVSAYPNDSVTVAEVEALRAGDIEIAEAEYNTLLADIVATPVPTPAPEPFPTFTAAGVAASSPPAALANVQTILAKADADITAGEVKTLVLLMARYFYLKWLGGWR